MGDSWIQGVEKVAGIKFRTAVALCLLVLLASAIHANLISQFSSLTLGQGAFNNTYTNDSASVFTAYFPNNNSFIGNGTFYSQPFVLSHSNPAEVTAANWSWYEPFESIITTSNQLVPIVTASSFTTVNYANITLNNTQPVATAAPYQQLLNISSFLYGQYIWANWSNVVFSTQPGGFGTQIPAWIESNPSNSSTSTLVWLNLPNGIPASSNLTIYMNFLNYSVMSANGPTGEAPQLSSTYGQYDDGAQVFNYYNNFSVQSSLNGYWSGGALTATANNGFSLTSTGQTEIVYKDNFSAPFMYEVYGEATATVLQSNDLGLSYASNPGYSNLYRMGPCLSGRSTPFSWDYSSSNACTTSAGTTPTPVLNQFYVLGFGGNSTAAQYFINYTNIENSSTGMTVGLYTGYGIDANGADFFYWTRTRAYPPNGIMPTVNYNFQTPPPTTSAVSNYTAIILLNSQAVGTLAPFQEFLTINSSAYGQYIWSNWSNVVFSTGPSDTGSNLTSWVEANASNSSTQTYVWVNLPNGIGANSAQTVYMNFMNYNVMNASGPTGEAPNLSSTYGQYDDGQYVFNFYDNFNGTSLNTSKWKDASSGTHTLTVNNGINISTNTAGASAQINYAANQSANNFTVEALLNINGSAGTDTRDRINHATSFDYGMYAIGSATPVYYYNGYASSMHVPIATSPATYNIIDSASLISNNTLNWNSYYTNYSVIYTNSTSSGVTTNFTTGYGASLDAGGATQSELNIQWTRIRAYPPAGVMPAAYFNLPTVSNTSISFNYTQLSLDNTQGSATAAPFQDYLTVNSSAYSSYIWSNWSNVVFSTQPGGVGTELPAWIESGPNTTTNATEIWLKIPTGISANTNYTAYMNFMNYSVLSPIGPTGESPNLSTTFGEYDDGSRVFDIYANFEGTSEPPNWFNSEIVGSFTPIFIGGTSTLGGMQMMDTTSFASTDLSYDLPFNNTNIVAEASWMYYSPNSPCSAGNLCGDDLGIGLYASGIAAADGIWNPSANNGAYYSYEFYNPSYPAILTNGARNTSTISNDMPETGTNFIFSQAYANTTGVNMTFINTSSRIYGTGVYSGLSNPSSNSSAVLNTTGTQLYIGAAVGSEESNIYLYWFRVRGAPPNQVMPTAVFNTNDIQTNAPNVPVLDMHFENDTKDDSPYNNSGSLYSGDAGSPVYPAFNPSCEIGGCYSFDGGANNQSILEPNPMPLQSGFTINYWVDPASFPTATQAIGYNFLDFNWATRAGIYLGLDGNYSIASSNCSSPPSGEGQILAFNGTQVGGEGVFCGPSIPQNQWTMLTFIGNESNASLSAYINGNYSFTTSMNFTGFGNNATIGGSASSLFAGNPYYNGSMDELTVWNQTLSATQVQQAYSLESSGKYIDYNTNVSLNVRAKNYTFSDSGLVGWWDFGDSSDNESAANKSLDLSGNGNNAVFPNSSTLTTGKCVIGNCITLNNTAGQYALGNPSNSLNLSNNLTISAWINPATGGSTIVDHSSSSSTNYRLSLGMAGNPTDYRVGVWNSSRYWLAGIVQQNAWSQVVWTQAGNNASVYINGTLAGTSNQSLGPTIPGADLYIGGDVSGDYFNGSFDDVKIWNRTLSATEVSGLYNNGCPTCAGGEESNWSAWGTTLYNGNALLSTPLLGNLAQVKATLASTTPNSTAFLQNITLDYQSAADYYSTTLYSPANDSNYSGAPQYSGNVNFSYYPNSTLATFGNATLWANFGGAWQANVTNQSQMGNGTLNYLNVTGIPQGVWLWNVLSCDTENCSFAPQNYTITIDTTNPLAAAQISPANSSNLSSNTVNFTFVPQDALTGAANATLWVFNSTGTITNTTTNTTVTNGTQVTSLLTLAQNGNYWWIVQTCDWANNCANTTFANFTVDSSTPLNTMQVSPANSSIWNTLAVNFTFIPTDLVTGVQNTTLYIYNTSNALVNSTINATVTNGQQISTIITLPAIGNFSWTVQSCNYAGNCANTTFANFTADNVGPLSTIQSTPIPFQNQSSTTINFTFIPQDASIAMANTTVWVENSSGRFANSTTNATATNSSQVTTNLVLGQGVYNWTVQSCNIADLCSNTTFANFTIDYTSPLAAIQVTPLNNSAWGNAVINFTAIPQDALTGAANGTFYITNSTGAIVNSTVNSTVTNGSQVTTNITVPSTGTFNWTFETCDWANNCANTTFGNFIFTKAPPLNSRLVTPGNYSNSTSSIWNLTFIPQDANFILANTTAWVFNSTGAAINSTTNLTVANGSQVTNEITLPYNGVFNWTVQACNINGGCSNTSFGPFTFDSANPNPAIQISPTPFENQSTTLVNFTFIPSEGLLGAINTTLYLENSSGRFQNVSTNATIVNGTQVTTELTLAQGRYNWTVQTCDSVANCSNTTFANFTIQTNFPNPAIQVSPMPYQNQSSTIVNFTFIPSDSLTGAANATIYIENGTGAFQNSTSNTSITNGTQATLDFVLPQGRYNWTVETCNFAGNCANTSFTNFTIDNMLPLAPIQISPISYQNQSSLIVNFTFIPSDAFTGAANTTLWAYNSNDSLAYSTTNATVTNGSQVTSSTILPYNGVFNWTVQTCDWANNCQNTTFANFTTGTCVNLTDPTSYLGKLANYSGTFNVTQSITLCPQTVNSSATLLSIGANNVTVDCSGATLNGIGLSSQVGIQSLNFMNTTVENCTVSNFGSGIQLVGSSEGSLLDSIVANRLLSNQYGVQVTDASNVNISSNNFTSNYDGVEVTGTKKDGGPTYVNLFNNSIANSSDYGIYIDPLSNGIITGNTITLNKGEGFYAAGSTTGPLSIYNNIFNNSQNVKLVAGITGTWNTTKAPGTNIIGGINMGGNYWANPVGTGYSQTCGDPDLDGICDSPFLVTTKNTDYLPLALQNNIPPTIFISSPSNNSFVNGNTTLTAIASDKVGVTNVTFEYENSTTSYTSLCNLTTAPYNCIWQTGLFANSTEGYNITATAYDASGNTANTTIHLIIDHSAPIITNLTVTYPIGQTSVRNSQKVTLSMAVTDSPYIGNGINTSIVTLTNLNGTGNVTMGLASGSRSTDQWSYWNLNATANTGTGGMLLPIYVYDNSSPVNNLRSSENFYVIVDNSPPTYDSLFDTGPVYNNSIVTFGVNAYDNYELKGFIFSSNITGSWVNDSEVAIAGTAYPISLSKTVTTGNYSYLFYLFDDAGNINDTTINNFQVYGNAPGFSISLLGPNDGALLNYSPVNLEYEYFNGVAANCSIVLNDSVNTTDNAPANGTVYSHSVPVPDGTYTWLVECVDNSTGNEIFSDSRTFSVDSDVGSISITNPVNGGNYSSSPNLTYDYSEDDVFGCWYSLDGGYVNSTNQACNAFTGLSGAQGLDSWTVYLNDTFGNLYSSTVNFTLDSTMPLPAVQVSPLNYTNQSTSLTVNFTFIPSDALTGAANATLWAYDSNGSLAYSITNATVTNGSQVTNSPTLPYNGVFNWTVETCDWANNCQNTTFANFTADDQYPLGTIQVSPTPLQYQSSNTVNFTFIPLDANIAIANTTLYVQNQTGAFQNTSANSSAANGTQVTVDLTLAQGTYNWTVQSCNAVGLCANTTFTNFTIQTTFPNPAIQVSPIPYQNQSSTTVNFTFIPSDSFTGTANTTIYIENGTGDFQNSTSNTSITNGTQVTLDFTLSQGRFNWTVQTCNLADLCANTSFANFTIDNTPPLPAVQESPLNNSFTGSPAINFTFIPQDAFTGAANTTLWVFNSTGTITNTTTNTTVTNGSQVTSLVALSQNGDYWWVVQTCDWANNCANTTFANFTLSDEEPLASIILSPSDWTNSSSSIWNFTFIPQDAFLPVSNTTLWVFNSSGTITNTTTNTTTTNGTQVNVDFVLPAVGKYNSTVQVCNNQGFCSNTSWGPFWFDNLNPEPATQVRPIAYQNQSSTIVNFTFIPSEPLLGAWNTTLFIENSAGEFQNSTYNSTVLNGSQVTLSLALSQGRFNWTVQTCDSVANCSNTTFANFTIDNTPPLAPTQISPIPYQNQSSPTVNLTFIPQDAFTGAANATLWVYNSNDSLAYSTTNATITNGSQVTNSPTLPYNGVFNWTVQTCDWANNCANTTFTNFTVDNKPPLAATQVTPIPFQNQSSTTVNFTFIPQDANIDLENTTLYVITPGGAVAYWAANTSVQNGTQTTLSATLTQGTYNWTVETCNYASNCANTSFANFTIDTTNPLNAVLVSPLNYSNYSTSTWNFIFIPSDALTGAANTSLWIFNSSGSIVNQTTNGTVSNGTQVTNIVKLGANGVFNWTVQTCDWADNCINTSFGNITFDSANPLASIQMTPQNNSIWGNPTINFTVIPQDALTGAANGTFYITNSTGAITNTSVNSTITNGSQVTANITLAATGTYNWTFETCDWANNCANTTFGQFNYTTAGPLPTKLVSPANYSNYSSSQWNFTFIPQDANFPLANTTIWVFNSTGQASNEVVNGTVANASQVTNEITLLYNGVFNWTVQACNVNGACTNTSFGPFTYDSASPLPAVQISPTPFENQSETTVNFTFIPSDGLSGAANTTLYVENASGSFNNITTNTTVTNGSQVTLDAVLGQGRYNWTVETCDWADNCANTTFANFTIDDSNPLPAIQVSPIAYQNQSSTTVNFTFIPADAVTGAANTTVYVINSTGGAQNTSVNTSVTNGSQVTLSIVLPEGRYPGWTVQTCDWANNCQNTSFSNFTIDNTPPLAAIQVSPLNNSEGTSEVLNFSYIIQDALTGSANATLYVTNQTGSVVNSTLNATAPNGTVLTNQVTLSSEGFFNWTVQTCDWADNCQNTSFGNFTIDNTPPPYFHAISPSTGEDLNSTFNVSFTVGDDYTGVANTTTFIDSYNLQGENYSYFNSSVTNGSQVTFNTTGIYNESYNVTVQACDLLGNCGNHSLATNVNVYNESDFAPQYDSNSTNDSEPGAVIQFNLHWSTPLSLSSYIFSFDNGSGTLANSSLQQFTGTSNWTNVTEGVNQTNGTIVRWMVYANNSVGQLTASATYYLTLIDVQGAVPSNLVFSPANGSTQGASSNYTFNSTVNSLCGISQVLLSFDGVNYTAAGSEGNYSLSFPAIASGTYPIEWFAQDNNGVWGSSGLTSYYVAALPGSSGGSNGGGGGGSYGGGGGGSEGAPPATIRVSVPEAPPVLTLPPLNLTINQGNEEEETFIAVNPNVNSTSFYVTDTGGISSLVAFETTGFTLEPGASTNAGYRLYGNPSTPIGTYSGDLEVVESNGTVSEEQPVTINLLPSQARLMDVVITTYDSVLLAGDNLSYSLDLKNVGNPSRYDVTVKASLTNSSGTQVALNSYTVSMTTELALNRTLDLPPNLPPGTYSLEIQASYFDPATNATKTASSSESVKEMATPQASPQRPPGLLQELYASSGLVALLVILAFLAWNWWEERRKRKAEPQEKPLIPPEIQGQPPNPRGNQTPSQQWEKKPPTI